NCDLKEFLDVKQPDGSLLDGGQRILDALSQDRYGIAYSNLRYRNPEVKDLALPRTDDGPYYRATKENLIQGKYPLTRFITTFINRAPGHQVDPKLKE